MIKEFQNRTMTREGAAELLQEFGIQATQQRIEIAQILFAKPQHLSAEQVMNAVNSDGPAVSKATVYNTLGLFAQKGLVREVIVDPTRVFYDSNTHMHHHFYNVDTGALTDIEPGRVNITDLPDLPQGTEPEAVEVIIRVRENRAQA